MSITIVFIRGHKIDIEKYYDSHGVKIPDSIDDFVPFSGDQIFVVDSCSLDFQDYGFYFADEIIIQSSKGKLEINQLNLMNYPVVYPDRDQNYCSEYDYFCDTFGPEGVSGYYYGSKEE